MKTKVFLFISVINISILLIGMGVVVFFIFVLSQTSGWQWSQMFFFASPLLLQLTLIYAHAQSILKSKTSDKDTLSLMLLGNILGIFLYLLGVFFIIAVFSHAFMN